MNDEWYDRRANGSDEPFDKLRMTNTHTSIIMISVPINITNTILKKFLTCGRLLRNLRYRHHRASPTHQKMIDTSNIAAQSYTIQENTYKHQPTSYHTKVTLTAKSTRRTKPLSHGDHDMLLLRPSRSSSCMHDH
jgi:hypothetical protein